MLAGGPGQSAVDTFPPLLAMRPDLRRGRDVVLIDQRGTGGSMSLACPRPKDKRGSSFAKTIEDAADLSVALAHLRKCHARLQPKYDLGAFTTDDAVDDIERVRKAMGDRVIDLMGVSYGTRLGLAYLQKFGTKVRAAVLDGVAPADKLLPLSMPVTGEAALKRVLDDCRASEACNLAFPNLSEALATLRQKLAAGPQRVNVRDPGTGVPTAITVTDRVFLGMMRGALYNGDAPGSDPPGHCRGEQGEF